MEDALFYVVILELTTVVGILRNAPPYQIPGTELYLQFRPAEGRFEDGVALRYRNGLEDLVDMISADAWRKLPLGAEHLSLNARRTFRVFLDESAAIKGMGAKLLADDQAAEAKSRR